MFVFTFSLVADGGWQGQGGAGAAQGGGRAGGGGLGHGARGCQLKCLTISCFLCFLLCYGL